MDYLVYVDVDGQLRAYASGSPSEFDALHESLEQKQIIFLNGAMYPDNIPEVHRDVAPAFLRTLDRQWGASRTFLAPKVPPAPVAPVEAPVAAPKPKRKPRKKKDA